jgi:hypothetical protein
MKFVAILFLLFSASAMAVTGGGTGNAVQVAGAGTGSAVQVTGGGSGTEVTGGGSGAEAVVTVDACITGSWFDPENNGEGINVEVLPNGTIVVYFYRKADVSWVLLTGDYNGLVAYQPFADRVDEIGDGYIKVIDEDTVEFGWDFGLYLAPSNWDEDTVIPWCLNGSCEGVVEYTRLTQPIPCPEDGQVEVAGAGTGSAVQVAGAGTGSN